MSREYDLSLHWKQGDDFGHCLKESGGNTSLALETWAKHFAECQNACLKIAKVLKGKDVESHGSVHVIRLYPGDNEATEALEMLVREDLISAEDIEDFESEE